MGHVRVVRVEVLVDVEDEAGGRAVGVGNLHQSGTRAVRDEGSSGRVVVTGEQDELLGGAIQPLRVNKLDLSFLEEAPTQLDGWR